MGEYLFPQIIILLIIINKMQAYTSQGYPRNLSYTIKRLSGFSRQNVKIVAQNLTTASAGQIISFQLPQNSIVDLTTLSIFFSAVTSATAGGCVLPRRSESLISRIEVETLSTTLSSSCQNMNLLYNILFDTTCGTDAKNKRSIMQLDADQAPPTGTNVSASTPLMWQNFLGFLSSVPTCNTSLTGPINCRITLADTSCLISNGAATGQNFTLSNIFGSVDIIAINDEYFNNSFDALLASNQTLEVPYQQWYMFANNNAGLNQSTRFSLNTGSLVGTFVPGLNTAYKVNAISGIVTSLSNSTYDPISKHSTAFTTLGGSTSNTSITFGDATNNTLVSYPLASTQFQINNSFYPMWPVGPEQAYGLMLNSLGVSQTVDGGISPNCSNLTAFTGSHWCHMLKLNHGESTNVVSGINTKGNSVALAFNSVAGTAPANIVTGTGTTQTIPNLTPIVFCQVTSILQIAQGQQTLVIT